MVRIPSLQAFFKHDIASHFFQHRFSLEILSVWQKETLSDRQVTHEVVPQKAGCVINSFVMAHTCDKTKLFGRAAYQIMMMMMMMMMMMISISIRMKHLVLKERAANTVTAKLSNSSQPTLVDSNPSMFPISFLHLAVFTQTTNIELTRHDKN